VNRLGLELRLENVRGNISEGEMSRGKCPAFVFVNYHSKEGMSIPPTLLAENANTNYFSQILQYYQSLLVSNQSATDGNPSTPSCRGVVTARA